MRLPKKRLAPRRRQRGAVAIIVGLSLAVLIGAAGLALDGGQLYVNKTETQNAADACALAASFELTGAPNIPLANFPIAESAGRFVAERNRVGFQGANIASGDVAVEFGTSLSGSWVSAGSATADAKYVRCTINLTGITPWFMQVLGFGDQTVQSLATATLAPSQSTCTALPISFCAASTTPPDYGFVVGNWYNGTFGTSGQLTGSFGWIDYSPPAGGASEAAALLKGSGACTIAPGAPVGQVVGGPGAQASLAKAWNTRFGIYHPSEPTTTVPDTSGYGYTSTNWVGGSNAGPDFLNYKRPANTPYGTSVANGNAITGLSVSPPSSTVLQGPQLSTRGASRRISAAPIVDCAGFASSQTVPILDWACVLMLHPMNGSGGPETTYLEYLGSVSGGGPCASVGGVGNSTSSGPLVPALVQ